MRVNGLLTTAESVVWYRSYTTEYFIHGALHLESRLSNQEITGSNSGEVKKFNNKKPVHFEAGIAGAEA
ncbi:hypothetical protein J6590_050195 [Homalodisca vitripennis]|nr:hypothetical protein J6590_050195 [Homalodisca vitripennis]